MHRGSQKRKGGEYMSSKVKRRQVIRKAMAGLLSLAMAVTMITPAGSIVYAA